MQIASKALYTGTTLYSESGQDIMKKESINSIVCPVCKGKLELTVEEENEKEILTGALYCTTCKRHYPVVDSIPNLLPPDSSD